MARKIEPPNKEILVGPPDKESLVFHVQKVLAGERRFENAARSIYRMIAEKKVREIVHAGETTYDYEFFREGERHIIGWYSELNELVHFIKGAAEGDSAKEMAFVWVSEPGSGKTFAIDFLCQKYRQFLSRPENRRYTFKFTGLDEALGYDKRVAELFSMTTEDPMTLAMNLFEDVKDSKKFLDKAGFTSEAIEGLYKHRRPLGASTEYLWYKLMSRYAYIQPSSRTPAIGVFCLIMIPKFSKVLNCLFFNITSKGVL